MLMSRWKKRWLSRWQKRRKKRWWRRWMATRIVEAMMGSEMFRRYYTLDEEGTEALARYSVKLTDRILEELEVDHR